MERSPSMISRELQRNENSHRPYSPSAAQRRYEKSKKRCGRKPILANQAINTVCPQLFCIQRGFPPDSVDTESS